MLSRVAENLYWLGRDLERVENIARMAEVSHAVAIETGGENGEQQAWDAVLAATGSLELYAAASEEDPLLTPAEFLLLSSENPNSLRRTLVIARALARELREQLSREVWEEINSIYLDVYATRSDFSDFRNGMHAFCDQVRSGVASILGLFDNTVLMDEGRDWFRCGVYLERADMTSRIVDTKYFVLLPSSQDVGGAVDRAQWVSVLRSASAWQAFRMTHRGAITGPRVATMLVRSEQFPRSLYFCIRAFRRHFEAATDQTPAGQTLNVARELALLDLDLRSIDEAALVRQGLHEFMDGFQGRLIDVDRLIHEHIFRVVPSVA